MACVEAAIPVPNSRKKTDELFLYWLSESSTQELLRKELAKISGIPFSELEDKTMNEVQSSKSEHAVYLSPSAAVTNVLRPGSPNIRTPSPPLLSHRSPKSPRSAAQARSPKKAAGKSHGDKKRAKNGFLEEIDAAREERMLPSSNFLHTNHLETDHHVEGIDLSNVIKQSSRSHSPKPESLPVGPTMNQIPKPGTNNISSHIPRFYFPNGKPQPEENLQQLYAELEKLFRNFEGGVATFKHFPEIVKVSWCLFVATSLLTYLAILFLKIDLFFASCIGCINITSSSKECCYGILYVSRGPWHICYQLAIRFHC